jgi:hypothetical protein
MRWNVEGADAKTGKNRIVQVYAKDSADAEEKARKLGVLVTAVHESIMKPPGERGDDGADGEEETFDVAPQVAPSAPKIPAETLAYASPQSRAGQALSNAPPRNDRDEARRRRAMIPDYVALRNAAFVIGVFSTL